MCFIFRDNSFHVILDSTVLSCFQLLCDCTFLTSLFCLINLWFRFSHVMISFSASWFNIVLVWKGGTCCDRSLVFFISHSLYSTWRLILFCSLSSFVSSISCEYLVVQWVQAQYLCFIYQGNSFHVSSEYCCTVCVPNLCYGCSHLNAPFCSIILWFKFLLVILNFFVPLDFYINVGLADVLSSFWAIFPTRR